MDMEKKKWKHLSYEGRPSLGSSPVSSVVIAVAGTAEGVGCSHTAIMLAQQLARTRHTVALYEANGSRDFERIECVHREVEYRSLDMNQFHIRGVDYIKCSAHLQMGELVSRGYDYIILDIGNFSGSAYFDYFRDAHISIVVGSGSVWNQPDIIAFYDQQADQDISQWTLCIPLATKHIVKNIQRLVPIEQIYALPSIPDPFAEQENMEEVVRALVPIEHRNAPSNWLRRWIGKS
ncbi:ParA family protein [Paenibacillus aquistagni]|nr:ParA family protein [Paenibacillus aquistagni]